MNGNVRVRDLMSRPVRKLVMSAKVRDAAEFLRRWGMSGAPVLDGHGNAVGVFSLTDLAGHLHNRLLGLPEVDPGAERAQGTGEVIPTEEGFHFEGFDDTRVSDLMTPEIVCVDPDAPIEQAIRTMTDRSIHRVFVRKGDGPLEGVITTMDILRWVGRTMRARRRPRKPQEVA
jgi:predicted transcriptional regulator